MRGDKRAAVRDNVILELGLFLGRLGRNRSFIVVPRNTDLHLPSDLAGWITGTYDGKKKNPQSALGAACFQITRKIKIEGLKKQVTPNDRKLSDLSRRVDQLIKNQELIVIREFSSPERKASKKGKIAFRKLPKEPVKPS